jgi:capsular exopolysaccharide synthesis family protein
MPRSLVGGLLLGCFLGIMGVFTLDSLDNTVRTPEEAELISSLSTIAIIPRRKTNKMGQASRRQGPNSPDLSVREIYSVTWPKSEIAESYRALRTGILLSSGNRGSKVVLVTSAMPQDGKTTTSLNIAAVLAQAGSRVLLIDGDLRRPNIHRSLRLPNTAGLSTWLAGTDKEHPKTLPSGIPNLDILPTGPKPPYPAELLGLSVFGEMLEGFRSEYDHVVIDSPPVLSVTDAVLMSALSDSVLLVIRSRNTTKGALRRSLKVLHQANARIMGVVLNDFNASGEDYAYYHGYNRSTEYYSEHSSVDTIETRSNAHGT